MFRVLHVVGKMHRGGIETLLMEIYRRINRNILQFDFLCFTRETGFYDKEILKLGGRIFYATPRRESVSKNKSDIRNILRENNFDAVHMHLSSCSYITPLLVAKQENVRIRIAHSHNTHCNGFLSKVLHNYNKMSLASYSTHFLACSQPAAEWMFGSEAWKKMNGTVLKNGINIGAFLFNLEIREKIRNQLNAQSSFIIGFAGRFEEQKNVLYACKIFIEVKKRIKNAKLLLVGEGALHMQMDALLEEENVIHDAMYTGVVENVNEYMQAMDVFILPSLFEGLGIVAIEAQASGLPTILSDKVPQEAKVLATTQFLAIKHDNIEQWSETIYEFYKRKLPRNNVTAALIDKGYDINQSAASLQNLYFTAK